MWSLSGEQWTSHPLLASLQTKLPTSLSPWDRFPDEAPSPVPCFLGSLACLGVPRARAWGLSGKAEREGHGLTLNNVLPLSFDCGLSVRVGWQVRVPHERPAGLGGGERDRRARPQADGGDTTIVLHSGDTGARPAWALGKLPAR